MEMSSRSLMYTSTHRLKGMLTEVFKIVHKISPSYLDGIFTMKETVYDTRNALPITLPKHNTVRYYIPMMLSVSIP